MSKFTVKENGGRFHVVGPYLPIGSFAGTSVRNHADGLAAAMNSSDAATAQRGIDVYNSQVASESGASNHVLKDACQ